MYLCDPLIKINIETVLLCEIELKSKPSNLNVTYEIYHDVNLNITSNQFRILSSLKNNLDPVLTRTIEGPFVLYKTNRNLEWLQEIEVS